MKVYYDPTVDAAYIELSDGEPEGAVEIREGINVDLSRSGQMIGIEILDASKKLPLETLFKFEIDPPLSQAA